MIISAALLGRRALANRDEESTMNEQQHPRVRGMTRWGGPTALFGREHLLFLLGTGGVVAHLIDEVFFTDEVVPLPPTILTLVAMAAYPFLARAIRLVTALVLGLIWSIGSATGHLKDGITDGFKSDHGDYSALLQFSGALVLVGLAVSLAAAWWRSRT